MYHTRAKRPRTMIPVYYTLSTCGICYIGTLSLHTYVYCTWLQSLFLTWSVVYENIASNTFSPTHMTVHVILIYSMLQLYLYIIVGLTQDPPIASICFHHSLTPVQTSIACRQTSDYSAHWVSNCHTMEPCTMERMGRWSPWGWSLLIVTFCYSEGLSHKYISYQLYKTVVIVQLLTPFGTVC